MKVHFVYPILDSPPGINHGLAALSGVLRAAGHRTRLLQVSEALPPVPGIDEAVARVLAWKPDLVGLSVLTQQYGWARRFAAALKGQAPGLPLVVGGVHCTMVPEEVARDGLAEKLWDYICLGEGEEALARLCSALEEGRPVEAIPNLILLGEGKVRRNPVGPFPDLAGLPPKDYDLFDMPRITAAKKGWISILTSRGCPYRCTYCFNREIVRLYREEGAITGPAAYLRRYPIERIIAELRRLRAGLGGLEMVIFDDDLFTLDQRYVIDFCRAYREAGIGLPFVVNAHPQSFDREMAAALAAAGCTIVKFGIESGSPRVRREVLHRPMGNGRIAAALAAAHACGLHTSAFIMLGLPTESMAEIGETLQLCVDVEVGRFRWAIFYPFPGTMASRIARERDLVDPAKEAALGGNYFDSSCLRFSPEQDLLIEKLAVLCPWYVNARGRWECAGLYGDLVREVEAMDRESFAAAKEELVARDREISEDLIRRGLPHYSLRFSRVMGVHSEYVVWERRQREQQVRVPGRDYTLE